MTSIRTALLQAAHQLEDLPEGWFYNGRQYISLAGERTDTHPGISPCFTLETFPHLCVHAAILVVSPLVVYFLFVVTGLEKFIEDHLQEVNAAVDAHNRDVDQLEFRDLFE